ncbi:uncharacterized protein LOC141537199 [Cotesia typhae]|uniref:uncharacterized protein LOC141537199 n=2 Tax=Cotesia typhae TaxID=2053667 RepID=UPI003D69A2B9
MNDLKGTLTQMQRVCESSVPTDSTFDINCDDNDFKIPCSAIVDFNKFDGKLKSDKEYRNKIVCKLSALTNPNQAITRSTTAMMRLGLSRELALKFNLKKPNEKKNHIFIETEFYKLIKGVLVTKFSKSVNDPLPDATVNDSISSVLNHCFDWEGGRTERKKLAAQRKKANIDPKLGPKDFLNTDIVEQKKDDHETNESE